MVARLNRLEGMSILTSAVTLFCGNLYLTGDLNDEVKILLFSMILLANAVFITNWSYCLLEVLIVNLVVKYPKLQMLLCCCRRRSAPVTTYFNSISMSPGMDLSKLDNDTCPTKTTEVNEQLDHARRDTINQSSDFDSFSFKATESFRVSNPENTFESIDETQSRSLEMEIPEEICVVNAESEDEYSLDFCSPNQTLNADDSLMELTSPQSSLKWV